MNGIPEDLFNVACGVVTECKSLKSVLKHKDLVDAIAAALNAERDRCLECCDYVKANIRISNDRRRRFDIYDLNQTLQKATELVRERIDGSHAENWKPLEDKADD